jgi:predicted type IV restriction endonuclease
MQETWKRFVYPLIEDKKQDVEEETYHRHIENQLMLLGWEPWKGEIIHKQSLRIGNRNRMEPDILVARDGEYQFVIEVKRPGNTQAKEEITQLESYMRQLRLDVGIYIGEHIELFYDKPNTNHVVSVFRLAIDLEEKRGARFVELFSKERFSKGDIVDFCKERIQEIQRQNSLNKIRESLIADAQMQIAESLKPYLMDKYGNSFSEDEIKGMLATMRFTASADGCQPEPQTVIPPTPSTSKSNLIKCFLTRNADAKGLFNPADQSLTVLKGSIVNSVHVPKISDASRKKRDKQLADYTVNKDDKKVVKEDICFDTPSGAALFCVGGSANGWKEWKDEKGHELNDYRINEGTQKSEARFDTNRVTDPRKFQLDFWTRFKTKLEATGTIPTLQTPQPHNWYDVRIGRSNILLNNVCNTQKNFVGVKLYIRNPVVEKYFPALTARKNEINLALGCEPEWDANPTAMDKTIALFHQTDLTDPQKMEEALDWLVQQTIVFYNVFSKEVKGIK